MNFYHEWEAQHRHEELLREAERRHELNRKTADADGQQGFVSRLFGPKRAEAPAPAPLNLPKAG